MAAARAKPRGIRQVLSQGEGPIGHTDEQIPCLVAEWEPDVAEAAHPLPPTLMSIASRPAEPTSEELKRRARNVVNRRWQPREYPPFCMAGPDTYLFVWAALEWVI